VEQPSNKEPTRSEVLAKQAEKRKLLLQAGPGGSAGGSSETPSGGGKGRAKKSSGPTPEQVEAVQVAIDKLFETVDILTSDEATIEQKKEATNIYFKLSLRIACIRYLPFIVNHIELVNLIASGSIWGGYRAYLLAKPIWEGFTGLAGVASAMGKAFQPTEDQPKTAEFREKPREEKGSGQYGS